MLPADSISKIIIIKGASSVLYGANIIGGVINIITPKGTKIPQTSFPAAFGDHKQPNYYSAGHGVVWGEDGITDVF